MLEFLLDLKSKNLIGNRCLNIKVTGVWRDIQVNYELCNFTNYFDLRFNHNFQADSNYFIVIFIFSSDDYLLNSEE